MRNDPKTFSKISFPKRVVSKELDTTFCIIRVQRLREMGILTEWITEWLKGLLIEGIMGNLEGLFDTVNTRVGEISVQVGTTPAAWNAGVFSLIRQLSETVILPIAGLILTFVATYELIQMILEKNNMHEFDVANIYKWLTAKS